MVFGVSAALRMTTWPAAVRNRAAGGSGGVQDVRVFDNPLSEVDYALSYRIISALYIVIVRERLP